MLGCAVLLKSTLQHVHTSMKASPLQFAPLLVLVPSQLSDKQVVQVFSGVILLFGSCSVVLLASCGSPLCELGWALMSLFLELNAPASNIARL